MRTGKRTDAAVLTTAVLGSLLFLNILGLGIFTRLDLTEERQFTLSQATRDVLSQLRDPVTVRAYFTKDLPPPYASNARYVKDLLDEYYSQARGNLRFEFIDPMSAETSEDKEIKKNVKRDWFGRAMREETSIEQELRRVGIQPLEVRVNQDDKFEVKRAYMGIALHYQQKTEVLPVVQNTAGLEYDLTTLIRKISRDKVPVVGFVSGHGVDMDKELTRIRGVLGHLYQATTVDLTAAGGIADSVDALLVVNPKTEFSEAEKRAIDGFIQKGRSVAFLLSPIAPQMRQLTFDEAKHNLADMLATYGVRLGQGLVLDAECAVINIQQQRGGVFFAQPMSYPLLLQPKKLDANHPLTRGLAQVVFPFMSPVEVELAADSGIKSEVLVRSSPRSWLQMPPYDLDPFQRWSPDFTQAGSGKNLIVSLSGKFKSHFAPAAAAAPSDAAPNAGAMARIVVAGGGLFASDEFASPANEALLLNLVDWLVLDEALLAVRSRGLAARTLDELSDTQRQVAKYFNVAGVPLLFIAFGMVRWWRREVRRRRVTL